MHSMKCATLCLATLLLGAPPAHAHDEQFEDNLAVREHAQTSRVGNVTASRSNTVKVQILGINDFHGRLSPGLTVASRPVGGAAVLASYLRDETARFSGTTFIVHAGDHVGASPPNSALLQDEPAIAVLNALANPWCAPLHGIVPRCNVVGTPGNHEFDEGVDELLRLVYGGNHPDGPFLVSSYRGASFPYVSANIVDEETGRLLLLPFVVREAEGQPIAFVGATLRDTPSIVTPEGVAGVRFLDEADAINRQVKLLRALGVRSIVVLLHQGGRQTAYEGATQQGATLTGEIANIVARLDGEVDVLVSGHAHGFSNALLPNSAGKSVLVTQAFSSGTGFGDIELQIDRRTHDVVEKSAVIVTTFADVGPGLTPAQDVARLVARADATVAPRVSRVVGQTSGAFDRVTSAAGESSLGNLIADAQRAAMQSEVALMNPGGVRADLDGGDVTWGELFAVQPFGNDLVRMELSGAQLRAVLEQQWPTPDLARILHVSGLRVTWQASAPVGSRVVSIEVNGAPLDDARRYSVTVNSFLAGGGDGFTVLSQGTSRVVGPVDLNALVDYAAGASAPLSPSIEGRIVRLP